jgi:aspartyl-tRNA(Asn)/glutamyl-tRNA(Gln) amidotransferase subunit C
MANLTKEDVFKLARLARIDLTEEEAEKFTQEFTAILGYVEQLKNVNVAGLKPTSQVTGLTNVMRKDQVQDYGYKPKDLLKNVPHVKDDQIQVKRMVG